MRGTFTPLKTRGPLLYRLTAGPFLFQEERAVLSKELSRLTWMSPAAGSGVVIEPATAGSTPACTEGSSGTTAGGASLYAPSPPECSPSADGRSRGISGQFHAEGGRTDGCYALYGGADGAERSLDQVLQLMKVRRGLSSGC